MSISKVNVSGTDHQIVGSPRYATCSTAAETAAKVATIADGSSTFSLEKGARICVSFTYANTASAATLNVANTGAKAIYWNGSALVSSQYWQSGAVVDFVYDGNGWSIVGVAKDKPVFWVTITQNTTDNLYSADKTYSEIIEAYNNGYMVQAKYSVDDGTNKEIYSLMSTYRSGSVKMLYFVYLNDHEEKRFTCRVTATAEKWLYKESSLVPSNLTINNKPLSSNITLTPSDINAQSKITANGILKGDGAGGVSAAVKGTDYFTPADVNEIAAEAAKKVDISDKVSKSGDTMTGKLTVPQVETGDGNSNYFQCRKFRGEGDANTYYHAIDFGYANHDKVDFHEYGGIWNFFKNTSGKANEGVLCGSITSNGWEGRAKLKSGSTMVTSQLTENSNAIATTAFVHGLIDNVKHYSASNPPPYPVTSVNNKTGAVTLAKGDVGLSNVDNTSDANKPISNATQAALNDKQSKITANGILKGDGAGNITAADETEVELVDLPQQVFWATYGKTTPAELNAAWNAGKLIKLKQGPTSYELGIKDGNKAYFYGVLINSGDGSVRRAKLDLKNGTWEQDTIGSVCDIVQTISLPTASWTGSDPYTQTVSIFNSNAKTKVDIQPSEEIYDQLVADNVGYLAIKNVNGTLTAVAKGGKPSVDLTVQVTYNNVY